MELFIFSVLVTSTLSPLLVPILNSWIAVSVLTGLHFAIAGLLSRIIYEKNLKVENTENGKKYNLIPYISSFENEIRKFRKDPSLIYAVIILSSLLFFSSHLTWQSNSMNYSIIGSGLLFCISCMVFLAILVPFSNMTCDLYVDEDKITLLYRKEIKTIYKDDIENMKTQNFCLFIKLENGENYRIWAYSPDTIKKHVTVSMI